MHLLSDVLFREGLSWKFLEQKRSWGKAGHHARGQDRERAGFPRWCLKTGLALGRWSAAVPWKKMSVVKLYPLTSLEPRHRFLQGATARVDQAGAKKKVPESTTWSFKSDVGFKASLHLWEFRQLGVKEPVPDMNPPIVKAGVEAGADMLRSTHSMFVASCSNAAWKKDAAFRSWWEPGQIRNPQRAERRRSLATWHLTPLTWVNESPLCRNSARFASILLHGMLQRHWALDQQFQCWPLEIMWCSQLVFGGQLQLLLANCFSGERNTARASHASLPRRLSSSRLTWFPNVSAAVRRLCLLLSDGQKWQTTVPLSQQ